MAESAMKRLAAMAKRCDDLCSDENYGDIARVRALPDTMASAVRALNVSGRDYAKPMEDVVALFKRVLRTMEAQERERGEEVRRTRLLALADELDRLRRDMAALLPAAVVELAGRVAELRREAAPGLTGPRKEEHHDAR